MVTLGFLHTAHAHVGTFDDLTREVGATAVHTVLPDLLDRARESGADPDLLIDVQHVLAELASRGADVVVCTCSTLGPIAEQDPGSTRVLRIDRPMARAAVRLGSRIGVVAAVESTLVPTTDLLADEATRAGSTVVITTTCVPGAWPAFEAGDTAAYLARIADAARSLAPDADVIVLAQASMAGALELLEDLAIPVLASPRLAVEAAIRAS